MFRHYFLYVMDHSSVDEQEGAAKEEQDKKHISKLETMGLRAVLYVYDLPCGTHLHQHSGAMQRQLATGLGEHTPAITVRIPTVLAKPED